METLAALTGGNNPNDKAVEQSRDGDVHNLIWVMVVRV
jgi:hypothetical protein